MFITKKRSRVLVLAGLLLAAGSTSFASAGEVNRDLARSSQAARAMIQAMGIPDMPADLQKAETGGQWVPIAIKIIDYAGRVQTVYTVSKWFANQPSYRNCVYYGNANSTPAYCY